MISTVSYSQHEILDNIRMLYGVEYQLDATWGNGSFWPTKAPAIRMDIDPLPGISLRADVRAMPFNYALCAMCMYERWIKYNRGYRMI